MLFYFLLIVFSFCAKDEMLLPHTKGMQLNVADYILSRGLVFLFKKKKNNSL